MDRDHAGRDASRIATSAVHTCNPTSADTATVNPLCSCGLYLVEATSIANTWRRAHGVRGNFGDDAVDVVRCSN